MNRVPRDVHDPTDAWARGMYHRTMAVWLTDLLQRRGTVSWPSEGPVTDYRDHDWRRLYRGSILDD